MKKIFITALIIIFSLNCYSQYTFEKGYFIDNSNVKIECLIKNINWNYNPSEFEYMLTENSEKHIGTKNNIKEFGIYNKSKYCNYKVKIDNSSSNIDNLSTVREPVFIEEELFLKVLIEGKANLYEYKNDDITRFFFNKENLEISQLISKSYLIYTNLVAENTTFKQQLFKNLTCENNSLNKEIEYIKYNKTELISFFIKYNECNNHELVNFEKKEKRDLFNLSIRPGINSSSLSIHNNITIVNDVDFNKESSFRIGVEGEIILPYYKNKWAIIIEPTYQYFKSEKTTTAYFVSQNVKIDYKSIELPIGIRHYLFINQKSKLFLNASFIPVYDLKSIVDFENKNDLEINSSMNAGMGFGYKYNDRFSLEFNYHTRRELFGNFANWTSEYKTTSIIFGYTLF